MILRTFEFWISATVLLRIQKNCNQNGLLTYIPKYIMPLLELEAFEKKIFFWQEKTFATEELNIFAGINFRESYQIEYFAVPNFREFIKKL